MSATATQRNRHLELKTPLGTDALLITGFDGSEKISRYFEFDVDCIAPREKDIPFDKLIGQPMTVKFTFPGTAKTRFFNGICKAVIQGESDITYTHYRLEMVPKLWLLEHKVQSRIFQHINVPDILKKVLEGINVKFDIRGKFEPRDYCVQYYETDYWFASRLMEEEGIFFYFTHSDGEHQMVIGNTPEAYTSVVYGQTVTYKNVIQEQAQDDDFISRLRKSQELTCGKVTLRDHSLELTGKNLEASREIQESVEVGKANHKLKVADNPKLEIYQYPGEYAQRFDGIDRVGGERPADVQKIFEDNKRTAEIRMQEEAARSIEVWGRSTCRQFSCGHTFTIKTLPDDPLTKSMKSDGKYVITSVTHEAVMPDEHASGGTQDFSYDNKFTCIPVALLFRPGRSKYKPVVPGCQTATVVGPKGEEIFVDKYGRVKVQFHWDREGKNDADSSCWIRVGTNWCGRNWGVFFIPRIGQEVVVDFLEGDPDRPIIVGNVYNNDQMPAYELAKHKTRSWIKTNSTMGGVGFNEIRFEDKKGEEQIFIHGEKNQDTRIKNDCMENIMHDRHLTVGGEKDGKKAGNQNEEVFANKNLKVHKDQNEHIGGDYKLHVGGVDKGQGNVDILIDGTQKEMIIKDSHLYVKGNVNSKIEGALFTTVVHVRRELMYGGWEIEVDTGDKVEVLKKGCQQHVYAEKVTNVGGSSYLDAQQDVHIKAGQKVCIEAGMQLSLKVGGNFVDISAAGVAINGTMVMINSGGSAATAQGKGTSHPGYPPEPEQATEAKPTKPTQADDSKTGSKSC